MKKLLLCLFLIVFATPLAFASAPDMIKPVTKTTDSQIKATPGVVSSVIVSYAGVTAGDKIEIKNSTDSSGTAQYTCVAAAANGQCAPAIYQAGNYFDTAIFYDATVSGGAFTTQVQYF